MQTQTKTERESSWKDRKGLLVPALYPLTRRRQRIKRTLAPFEFLNPHSATIYNRNNLSHRNLTSLIVSFSNPFLGAAHHPHEPFIGIEKSGLPVSNNSRVRATANSSPAPKTPTPSQNSCSSANHRSAVLEGAILVHEVDRSLLAATKSTNLFVLFEAPRLTNPSFGCRSKGQDRVDTAGAARNVGAEGESGGWRGSKKE